MRSLLPLGILLAGCAHAPSGPPLQTVERVDLKRYVGTWYEIATIPMSFQKGCTGVTATYTLRADGDVDVVNTCRKERVDGELKTAKGKAWSVDPSNAKLEVQFFWPFHGSYWVIDLEPDYGWAVVGHPSREYLWILSRTPTMDAAVYDGILGRLRAQGYDTGKLVRTPQPPGPLPKAGG
jgi:apolipoprotein D and lipocalin family protein